MYKVCACSTHPSLSSSYYGIWLNKYLLPQVLFNVDYWVNEEINQKGRAKIQSQVD